jgi:hypothetical protein
VWSARLAEARAGGKFDGLCAGEGLMKGFIVHVSFVLWLNRDVLYRILWFFSCRDEKGGGGLICSIPQELVASILESLEQP